MHSAYRALAIGAATSLLALAALAAAGRSQPDSQESVDRQAGPVFDKRGQFAPPDSTFSMGTLHAEGHDGVPAEPAVPHTQAVAQMERDASLTGTTLPPRLPNDHSPAAQHRTQDLLHVDSEVALERFGGFAASRWEIEHPHLIVGPALVLLVGVLAVLRPRSTRSPTAPERRLMHDLRAWLTSRSRARKAERRGPAPARRGAHVGLLPVNDLRPLVGRAVRSHRRSAAGRVQRFGMVQLRATGARLRPEKEICVK